MFLEEGTSAWNILQNSLDAGHDPLAIGDLRARPGVAGRFGEVGNGREERVVHGEGYAISRH